MTRMTPKAAGFHMPPEWAPHARTWMMWPSRAEVWDDMAETCRNYTAVAHAIARFEPLTMLVRPEDRAAAHAMLGSDVELLEHPIDDSWSRDCGPNFVIDGKGGMAASIFEFNAWGGKYAPFDGDNSSAAAIAAAAGAKTFASNLIAEGGGISVDGEGTLLTTISCFPNVNRNPDWTRDAITKELCEMFGVSKVIWLPGNPLEVETDGHVDGIAQFIAPGVVLCEGPGPKDGEWYDINVSNVDALRGQTDAAGRELTLIEIPDASQVNDGRERFCASYVNSYICNGAVIMPAYGIAEDDMVRDLLAEHLPGREVVQVPIPSIAIGGGGIHCITQQEPKV